MGGLLGEAADDGVIVSGPEIVGPSLLVIILPGVAEGVGIGGDRVFLVAIGVILIGLGDGAFVIGEIRHIPVAIVQIIAAAVLGDQIHAVDILAQNRAALEIQNNIVPIIEMLRHNTAGGLGEPQTGGQIIIGRCYATHGNLLQFAEGIVGIIDGRSGGSGVFLGEGTVAVVGIGGGAGGAALGLGLGGEPVGEVVSVGCGARDSLDFLCGPIGFVVSISHIGAVCV